MRVFVVGASGETGTRLVPQPIERRHAQVARRRRALGAVPRHLDLLDRDAVMEAVVAHRPDAIFHEATALADLSDFKHFDRTFRHTDLLRAPGHGRPDRGRASGGCHPLRRAHLRQRALRAQRGDGDALGPRQRA